VDGRVAISAPPGAWQGVERVLEEASRELPFDLVLAERLAAPVHQALAQAGLPPPRNPYYGKTFACNADLVRRWHIGDCRRLQDESIPSAAGLRLPVHCFPDGIVYGVVEDGQVVSYAHAHRSGILEDRVADLGVETAEAYRRRGFAKTVVSAVTAYMTRTGGEGLYHCSASNLASVATARSVGYELYGNTFILTTNLPGESG
jgi:GNAT superfamily N-acetyltransferase